MISYIDPTNDLLNIFNYVLNFQSYSIGTFGLNLYGILLNFYRSIPIISNNYFGFQNILKKDVIQLHLPLLNFLIVQQEKGLDYMWSW